MISTTTGFNPSASAIRLGEIGNDAARQMRASIEADRAAAARQSNEYAPDGYESRHRAPSLVRVLANKAIEFASNIVSTLNGENRRARDTAAIMGYAAAYSARVEDALAAPKPAFAFK